MLHFYLEANLVGYKKVNSYVLHDLVNYMKKLQGGIYHLDCDYVVFHGPK